MTTTDLDDALRNNPFADQQFVADATNRVKERLDALLEAWDADYYFPDSWTEQQAEAVISELLTLLGFGTPTMRGEYCDVELPDGSRCVFGRHHKVRYHHSSTGLNHPAK